MGCSMTIGNAWAECWNENAWAVGAWQTGSPPEPPVVPSAGGGGSRGTIYEDRRYYERQAKRRAAEAAKLAKPEKTAEIEKAIEAAPEPLKTDWTEEGKAKLIALLLEDAKQFEQVMMKYYELLLRETERIEVIQKEKMARLQRDDQAIEAILLTAW